MTTQRTVDKEEIKGNLMGFGVIALFAVLLIECGLWLKRGTWDNFTLDEWLIPPGSPLGGWLSNPSSWFGVHKILLWLYADCPLFVWVAIVGAVAVFMVDTFWEDKEKTIIQKT